MDKIMTISNFRFQYRWLSNFYLAPVEFEGLTYPSTEHAYQAAKIDDPEVRKMISELPEPKQTKQASHWLTPPENWHTTRKFEVMELVLREKFKHEDLALKLLATGEKELIEGNTWHDTSWGVCFCAKCGNKGDNHLGKILMKIRKELKDVKNT